MIRKLEKQQARKIVGGYGPYRTEEACKAAGYAKCRENKDGEWLGWGKSK